MINGSPQPKIGRAKPDSAKPTSRPSSQSGNCSKMEKRAVSRTAAVATLWRALAIPSGEVRELGRDVAWRSRVSPVR
jgi:hypothetical protein